jgi:hypothetical protein
MTAAAEVWLVYIFEFLIKKNRVGNNFFCRKQDVNIREDYPVKVFKKIW